MGRKTLFTHRQVTREAMVRAQTRIPESKARHTRLLACVSGDSSLTFVVKKYEEWKSGVGRCVRKRFDFHTNQQRPGEAAPLNDMPLRSMKTLLSERTGRKERVER